MRLPEYKRAVNSIVREFLVEEDFEECLSRIHGLSSHFFHYEFVKRALTIAMEKGDKERELVSRLLSFVYGLDISMEQIGAALARAARLRLRQRITAAWTRLQARASSACSSPSTT